jgi:Ca2+:H+ antiporter
MKYLKSELPIAIALIVLGLGFALEHGAVEHGGVTLWGLLLVILAAIIGVAFRIAHHAEVLAMRLGEPYGTLILTLAAVSVEVVILIVLLQGAPNPTLARDPVFAAVKFDFNGILLLAAIVGGLKHGQTKYNISSANSYVAMLLVAIGIGMFVPDFVPDDKWQIYSIFSIGMMAVSSGFTWWVLAWPWRWMPAAACLLVSLWLWRLPTMPVEAKEPAPRSGTAR